MERWSKEELDNFVQDLQPIRFGKGCRSDRGGRPRNMQGIPRVLLFRLKGAFCVRGVFLKDILREFLTFLRRPLADVLF